MDSRKRKSSFFWYGFGSAFDLGLHAPPEFPCMPRMRTPQDDAMARARDWRRVGESLRRAMNHYANERAHANGERSRTGS